MATPAQITSLYNAAMDSVNLINRISSQTHITAKEVTVVDRNKQYLVNTLSMTPWTTENLAPLQTAANVVVTVK